MKKIPDNYDVWRAEDGQYVATRFEAQDCGAGWRAFAKCAHKYQAVAACIEDAAQYNHA